jgi:hypothetical protein
VGAGEARVGLVIRMRAGGWIQGHSGEMALGILQEGGPMVVGGGVCHRRDVGWVERACCEGEGGGWIVVRFCLCVCVCVLVRVWP